METYKTLADAVALAEFAHRHQKDKAGFDYIEHPKRVLASVQAQGVAPYVQIAAVLHDVPEDTAFSHEILLRLGFSEAVVKLTRLLDRDYSQFVFTGGGSETMTGALHFKENADIFYYQQIKANRDATIIKLADIRDNLTEWRLAYLSDEKQRALRAKYRKAIDILDPNRPGTKNNPIAI